MLVLAFLVGACIVLVPLATRSLEQGVVKPAVTLRPAVESALIIDAGLQPASAPQLDEAAALVGPAMQGISAYTRPAELVAAELVKSKQHDRATPLLKQIVRLNSQNAIAWLNLGRCLHRQKDFRGAAEALTCCLALEPENPNAKANLAAVNARLGRAANSILRESDIRP